MRLLLVEDDRLLADSLKRGLERRGFAVDATGDGIEGEFLGSETAYDLIILDLGLPGRSGLEILRNWRAAGNRVPVIVLTARDSWHERVDGLRAGADDYLGKPFHEEELLARMQALVRRSHNIATPHLSCGGVQLDEERQRALLAGGEEVALTGTEFRLLRYLMLNPGKILSKTRLTEHVYEQEFDRDSNLIEVYIRRLREKLGHGRIETRRGQGYIFVAQADELD
ncbi:MAG: response regulator transcription factor [Gammaproteobacteria bacterium]|nr:response regulator transcription factor [Gammaproteobacteria bacterium]